MKSRKRLTKQILSIALCFAVILSCLPMSVFAAKTATNPYYNRIVDVNTMDNWTKYFDINNLDTTNAGGVWTDKSVFTDASAFPDSVKMINDDENFLTALSALAANKEVVGYSTVPTDTVLVLDLSGSMENSNSEDRLIDAANSAIKRLLDTNNNNRVGVVLYSASGSTGTSTYSESVTQILPIDRYTTGSDGKYLSLNNQGTVSVDSDVRGTKNFDRKTKSFGGGTYIQAGLWEALKMFEDMDTVISDNNWQAGDNRMPILVLMSDGAPSTGTTNYANVGTSNVGNGDENGLVAGNAFLTQLTASYVINRIKAHYQGENSDVRGLFYTLGFNIGNNDVAKSVMNPDSSTYTDALWNSYNNLTTGSLSVRVKNTNSRSTQYSNVAITKNSYVTNKFYVDEYFSASGTGLTDAFQSIVDEIILQSRYYPTHLEGGSPDFSGYVEFEDKLGEYMEVKNINGILLGDTLYDGHMMASKLADTTDNGLGTPDNPTELGDEFIRAVKTRLGIASTADAQALVSDAFSAGQLSYKSNTEWSNYIGWYAKADGTYAGFWDENSTEPAPQDAVYKNKSYGFLGETTGSIKNSDMMYMSVQIRTDIATGEQTLLWKIPASLVPMVTYLVTLEGTNVEMAQNVNVTVENADKISPIRLIFESGLRSDLNELNITRITDQKHIAADGITRQFWTNYFDISASTHDKHITTLSEFTPSKENERFYYTFDSAVYKKVNQEYVLVKDNETLNENGEYYHRRYIFKNTTDKKPIFLYEKMSAASINAATWKPDFETLTGETGAYVVPKGTPARELQMYDEQKSDTDGIDTKSAHMVFHPYLTEENNVFYVDMNLGNNGLLEVTPAQGLRVSKTVDIVEPNTSTDFSFRITVHSEDGTPFTGELNSWITDLDVVPLGDPTVISLSTTGTYTFNLSKDQTFWLTGVPTGATYTVEEVSANDDYKIKSVHVNGASTGTIASGTIAAYFIDEVDFVNTAMGEGDLVITKRVALENGNPVDIKDDIKFTAEVTLKDQSNRPISGRFEASNSAGYIGIPASGKFTVTLSEGESFVLRNIPEGTKYTVVEHNIPDGFQFNADRSSMTGVIDTTSNDQVIIVNTYNPVGTDGQNVTVDVTKTITGNRTNWLDGESYSFEVKRDNTTVAQFTIDNNDADKKSLLQLTSEDYLEAGTYHYTISEVQGIVGGITYDTAERRFSVVVADADMDGRLEITAVNNEAYTTVTKQGNNYNVAANFNNAYAPTGSATVRININKTINDFALNGFKFGLYDSLDIANATLIAESTRTNALGKAHIDLTYAANIATAEGTEFVYYLAEINTGVTDITYDTSVYKVVVTVKDNLDGTISAEHVIYDGNSIVTVPTFTNVYNYPEKAQLILNGNKVLTNRIQNVGEFNFNLYETDSTFDYTGKTAKTATNNVNGDFVFETLSFESAGIYYFVVVEENSGQNIKGITYDNNEYHITVNVTQNINSSTNTSWLQATPSYYSVNDDATVDNIVFNNVYDPKDAEVTLSGTKILTGKTLQDDEFEFTITPTGNTALPANYDNIVKNFGGTFTFNKLVFDKAGVYTYNVTEKITSNTNYDYDESVYAVTVTVTDNSEGVLSARVSILKNGMESSEIVFRNGFVPTPITFDISAEFGGTKILDGRPVNEEEFEFRLINAINGEQIGDTVKNIKDGGKDIFKFPQVTIPEAGIYHYKITEIIGDEKGVSYDTASYHVVLEVIQDDNGILHIKDDTSTTDIVEGKQLYKGTVTKEEVGGVLTEVVHYESISNNGEIIFNNTYKADPAHVTLEAIKTLTGRDLKDGEFKFDLYNTDHSYVYDGKTPIQDDVVLTLKDDGTGNITFMPITFENEGTFYYVVVEDELDEKGITADKNAYKIEVTVTDNHDGKLVATIKVNGQDITGSTADTVKFHNTYTVAATEIVIKGNKVLTGRELKAGEFSFELYDNENVKIETVKNSPDGSFEFTAIPISEAGEYVYTIRELGGSEKEITYDDTVYTVRVDVTDNLDGTFKVKYTYIKGTETADGIIFTNVYTAPALEPDPIPDTSEPDIPKTGDNSNIWLWFALLFVSGTGLFGTTLYIKKRREYLEEN
ncbi:MAG: VWA domain-containing protein [Clostridia bacterium]|nr:VWA domain-containing protein [Clostridia bacterium]